MKPTNAAPRRLFWTDMENTKQDGISSGLVAVCNIEVDANAYIFVSPYGFPVVRLSDAEAIIVAKDAEIEQLTLYKNLADEYGLSVFADLKEQAERIKQMEAFNVNAAKGLLLREKQLEEQSAALKLARESIELEHDFGCCALYVERRDEALAAIDALGE